MARSKMGPRQIAQVSVLGALSLILLYFTSLIPTGQLGMVALIGVIPAAAVVSAGIPAGFLCYLTTGLLGLLLIPKKGILLLYLLFFGLYPMEKSLAERASHRWLEWMLKWIFFNFSLSLFWFILRKLFLPFLPKWLARKAWAVYAAGNLAFIVYDLGFSALIAFYTGRIEPILRKDGR